MSVTYVWEFRLPFLFLESHCKLAHLSGLVGTLGFH